MVGRRASAERIKAERVTTNNGSDKNKLRILTVLQARLKQAGNKHEGTESESTQGGKLTREGEEGEWKQSWGGRN